MGGKLQSEIRQQKPFVSREEEVFLNILRTAESLIWGLAETLKPAGLTPTQYNVLRILRGAGSGGLACREIAERMVTKDSDITRLLDRLENQKFVRRTREQTDRRVVMTFITNDGLRILKALDEPVMKLHGRQLGHLGERRLRAFLELLEAAREGRG